MTKKIVTIALFIFISIGTGILWSGYLINSEDRYSENFNRIIGRTTNQNQTPTDNSMAPISSSPVSGQVNLVLNSVELAKHNKETDCWLLVSGKIYDVTNFIKLHPGGKRDILGNCGKEATQAFVTQGGEGTHSNKANEMIADYYLGDFNSSLQVKSNNSIQSGSSGSTGSGQVQSLPGAPIKSGDPIKTPGPEETPNIEDDD